MQGVALAAEDVDAGVEFPPNRRSFEDDRIGGGIDQFRRAGEGA